MSDAVLDAMSDVVSDGVRDIIAYAIFGDTVLFGKRIHSLQHLMGGCLRRFISACGISWAGSHQGENISSRRDLMECRVHRQSTAVMQPGGHDIRASTWGASIGVSAWAC